MSNRKQYTEKLKARLDQWNAEIDRLEAKANETEADVKIEYKKQLDELRAQRDHAEVKRKELRDVSDEAWNDMQVGFDKAWDNIAAAVERARGRFR